MLREFHPIVRQWFTETLGAPSEPQRQGWPAIAGGEHTLILAPTGTGKTLAAFLWELNALITDGLEEPLGNAVHLLYISPLKALNNDIQRNLERPLAELRRRFGEAGIDFPEIRVAVRTGDTPASARARMLRKSPHILITTPESLHILLTSVKGRGMFSAVRAVIVDEIHALAGGKRGAHLALTLERLEHLSGRAPQRIGLSATQRPLEEVARFLAGSVGERRGARGEGRVRGETGSPLDARPSTLAPRPCRIVDCGLVKRMETAVRSPVANLGDVGGSVWPAVAPLVLEQIGEARTTLVFVNNRAQAERMAARVNALAGEEVAQPYHGSLSRERRLMLEERLKAGELRALVTTSSLELGIDIGSVDVVVQLQSPKRVSAGLQRVGRAGHTLDAVSRGVLVPTFLDDAAEMVAIVDAMREGDVEPTRVVQNALDVLAQVIVAAVSVDDWTSAELFDLVRRAYPYHALTRAAYDEVLAMLAGKYPSDLAAELAQRVTWDRVSDRLSGSNASRMTAVVSGGTIPDRGLYTVNLPDRTRLGELDEEFVHESRIGDVFQLGSSTWRISAIEHDRVIVVPAPGAPARMPFWHGEYMARSFHLSARVGELRRALAGTADPGEEPSPEELARLSARYRSDESTIRSLVEYVRAQRAATGIVPDERTLVLEQFRDETSSVRLVLHAPFGGRVNAPWGMAIAQRVREQLQGVDVQVQTTDDGIMLRLPDLGAAAPVHAMLGLSPAEAEQRVLEEVGGTSLFGARFRMNAARALLLPRGNPRRRMPLWLQRLKALDLLQTVQEFPSFPILVETYRDVLQDAFDMPALASTLAAVERGDIRVHVVEVDRPSPFSASLQFGFVMDWLYGDDTPRAEQRAALLSLDRALLDEVMGSEGADDATLAALEEVLAERRGTAPRRRARTADELAVLLDRAGDLSVDEARLRIATVAEGVRGEPLEELLATRRAIAIDVPTADGPEPRLILTESFGRYLSAFGAATLETVHTGTALTPRPACEAVPDELRHATLTRGAAAREILLRHVSLAGSITVGDVRRRYALPAAWIARRLEEWQRAGKLVRTPSRDDPSTPRWTWRRVLEHARRRALARARAEVEAVPLAALVAFLQRWQHLDPRERLEGAQGTAIAIRQLFGLARPPEGWERDYLPARVARYDPASLSQLGANGEVVWIAGGRRDDAEGMRTLTSLRFVERGTSARWLAVEDDAALEPDAARVRDALARMGASFFGDLQSATGLGPMALREALRELAAAGVVTNDTMEAMREVIRARPLPARDRGRGPDPARWLPADFSPNPNRPYVQRRPNLRRLPKWRRPDLPGASGGWIGRWSLLRPQAIAAEDDESRAEAIARQWLERYGVVTRDWWRRERPPVAWRDIYRELKRLEFRGEVRRGYFVKGLGGAQFALPDAVEQLRSNAADAGAPLVVMAASDPANAYALALPDEDRDPLTRPRGSGALLVTRGGRVVISAEGRGRRLRIAPDVADAELTSAAEALARHIMEPRPAGRRRRDLIVETIDGVRAPASPRASAFAAAGYRSTGTDLRVLAPVG